MSKKDLVAAVTVLYNPDKEVISNINSYINNVDVVFCIDNSDCSVDWFDNNKKIRYLPQFKNIGLAKALNLGCKTAYKEGYKILITFDQDTVCECDTVDSLVNELKKRNHCIIVPNIKYIYRNQSSQERIFSEEILYEKSDAVVPWGITSATTMKSSDYVKLHGFDNKLFISQIDQEFCFRANKNGIKIYRLGSTYIFQELGSTTSRKFLGKKIHIPNLSPKRYYYIFRNEIYLRNKWGNKYNSKYRVNLFKYLVAISLFEKDKRKKIISCIEGIMNGYKIK